LVQLFDLTGTDRGSNLVRRAERRHHQSTGWRKTVQEVEASLGLNTEHKASPRQSSPRHCEQRGTPFGNEDWDATTASLDSHRALSAKDFSGKRAKIRGFQDFDIGECDTVS
jgi:hypothetical protein